MPIVGLPVMIGASASCKGVAPRLRTVKPMNNSSPKKASPKLCSVLLISKTGKPLSLFSDRFGEKLSEPFVVEALREVLGREAPRFALLAPDEDDAGCRKGFEILKEIKTLI